MKVKEEFQRTSLVIGEEAINKIVKAKVAIFGLGGVGSYIVEALARSGVGEFILVDKDIVEKTNINRQLYALHSTIGQAKVEIAKARILDINPEAKVTTYKEFWNKDSDIDLAGVNYIVDAIDSVSSKLDLVVKANELKIKIISAMGAGNKIEAAKFEVTDIYATKVCPLAKVMRKELKKRNISSLKVVYSTEEPKRFENKMLYGDNNILTKADEIEEDQLALNMTEVQTEKSKIITGSMPFIPGVVGLTIAGEVIKDLIR